MIQLILNKINEINVNKDYNYKNLLNTIFEIRKLCEREFKNNDNKT